MKNKNKNNIIALLVVGIFTFLALSCSTVQMADIPATADPCTEITSLKSDLNFAVSQNVDVLAPNDFKESMNSLNKAERGLENKMSQSDLLDLVRKGRGYLQRSYDLSKTREGQASSLFAARQMALKAGASVIPELKNDLSRLDSDVSSVSDNLLKSDAKKLSDFENRYIDLERKAVISIQLGKSQALLNGADKENATRKAPVSYKKAELSLKSAESIISTNVRNPVGFNSAVTQANTDAMYLSNVMLTIAQNGKGTTEPVAMKMVDQNKKILGLSENLDQVKATGLADKNRLREANTVLLETNKSQNKALDKANSKNQIQEAIENARTGFSQSEAEVYQQGENLVIRLKQINFATGRSDLPANALASLSKVSEVANFLDASQIKVEGHTDSTGTAEENNAISDKRANTVAEYFKSNGFSDIEIKSEGFGFKNPMTTNKTKEGRAQNRRVDIIITPKSIVQ